MQFSFNVFWCFVNHLGAKRHLLCFGSIAAQAGVPDWKTPEDTATTLVFIAHLRRSEWIGSDREICTAKSRVNVLRLFIKDAFKFPSIEMYFLFLPPPPLRKFLQITHKTGKRLLLREKQCEKKSIQNATRRSPKKTSERKCSKHVKKSETDLP